VRASSFALVNDEPVALCDSYYPAELAEGTALAEAENIEGGACGLIEDPEGPIGRRLRRSIDELASRMPTPAEVEVLKLEPGVPVLRILRTVYDADGEAVEVQETVAAADKHELRYEVKMRSLSCAWARVCRSRAASVASVAKRPKGSRSGVSCGTPTWRLRSKTTAAIRAALLRRCRASRTGPTCSWGRTRRSSCARPATS
jgi:GntR family transcriptional regulator